MLEFMICSMVTIFPDYLFRRYAQGKRWGSDINVFTMWFELRWGITACLVLTISLITVIFYYHPTTQNVTSIFRTVTILPETPGRVAEVLIGNNEDVVEGQVLFRLESGTQQAAVETAKRQIEEIDAALVVAQNDLAAAEGSVVQADGSYRQALEELATKQELFDNQSTVVSAREIERLQIAVDGRLGGLDASKARRDSIASQIDTLLPAQKASAEATLAAAEVELAKMDVRAGVDGRVAQFVLQEGDYISAILRPAGIIVPSEGYTSGEDRITAGFDQISAQVVKVGTITEVTCISNPFVVIPMVVVNVQEVISSGQLRPTDQLIDLQERARPGTLTVAMEPLYAGQIDAIPPGSKCIANAYTSNHDRLDEGGLGTGEFLFLHMVDTVGLVHALILRIQALLLPVQTLVLSGH